VLGEPEFSAKKQITPAKPGFLPAPKLWKDRRMLIRAYGLFWSADEVEWFPAKMRFPGAVAWSQVRADEVDPYMAKVARR